MGNFLAAVDFEDFINNTSGEVNSHVLKNNEAALKKAYSFFQSDGSVLILNGFAGTGKKQLSEHLISYMNKETIVFRFICTESSKLDDLQLFFLKLLKQKTSVKNSPELDAIENVQEKIDFIFNKLNLNYVLVLYNFDSIKDENKPDILNYIYSISENNEIKTIITSRTFDTDIIPESVKYTKVMVKALSKEIFETYVREFGTKATPAMIDQLYRLTRGYFLSACLSCKIMINQEYTINDFIVQYTNSGQKFDEFLAQTYYRLIVGTTKSAFNLFVTLHHGLNIKVLQTIGSYPETILKTLSDNFYIYKKGDLYYPNEFLKLSLEPVIQEEVSKKRLIAYYEKQLELPVEERDFTISRASLQEEIAFYKDIPLEVKNSESDKTANREGQADTKEEDNTDYKTLPPKELFVKAEEFFNKYEYVKTIDALTILLSQKSSLQGSDIIYQVYKLLAKTYSKLKKWKYALYYYDLLERHYTNIEDKERVYEIQFERATVYYNSYRIIDSIKILKSLLAYTQNNIIVTGCNLLLGNIAISAENKELALQHFKTGIDTADESVDNKVKMELYFKYAILTDEMGDMNTAIEYYQKCIDSNDVKNKYKSLAYSNLGDLFYDNELKTEAKDAFEKAYELDKQNSNEYGMFYTLSKIIDLTDNKEKDKLLKLASEAKEHAKKTEDAGAINIATIKLGDIYYDYPEPQKALVEYLEIYRSENLDEQNYKVVKARLEDIRARLGKDHFEALVPDYE